MKFLEDLCSEDDEIVYQYTEKHYWYLLRYSCLYPKLDTPVWKAISIVQFIFIFFFLLYQIFTGTVTVFKLIDTQTLLFEMMHYIVLVTDAIFLFVALNMKRKYFAILHRYMVKGLSEYDCETENYRNKLNEEIMNNKKKLLNLTLISYVGICMSVFMVAPLMDSYLSDNNDQKEIYNKYGVSMNLPAPQWIPFGSDTLITFIFALCMQILAGGICAIVFMAAIIILLNCSLKISSELDLLIISIERLPERTLSLYRTMYGNRNVEYNKIRENTDLLNCYKECLKQNVQHHQEIIKMFNVFSIVMGPIFFVVLSVLSLLIGLSATGFVLAKGKYGARISSIGFCTAEILNTFFVCWTAEMIYSASQRLAMSLFSTNWNLVDKSNAKTIICMMIRTNKPLVMNYQHVTNFNFETFAKVMNSAYSYVNLLFAFIE